MSNKRRRPSDKEATEDRDAETRSGEDNAKKQKPQGSEPTALKLAAFGPAFGQYDADTEGWLKLTSNTLRIDISRVKAAYNRFKNFSWVAQFLATQDRDWLPTPTSDTHHDVPLDDPSVTKLVKMFNITRERAAAILKTCDKDYERTLEALRTEACSNIRKYDANKVPPDSCDYVRERRIIDEISKQRSAEVKQDILGRLVKLGFSIQIAYNIAENCCLDMNQAFVLCLAYISAHPQNPCEKREYPETEEELKRRKAMFPPKNGHTEQPIAMTTQMEVIQLLAEIDALRDQVKSSDGPLSNRITTLRGRLAKVIQGSLRVDDVYKIARILPVHSWLNVHRKVHGIDYITAEGIYSSEKLGQGNITVNHLHQLDVNGGGDEDGRFKGFLGNELVDAMVLRWRDALKKTPNNRTHIFETSFYNRVFENGYSKDQLLDYIRDYKLDLIEGFDRSMILICINRHWALAVADNRDRTITIVDSLGNNQTAIGQNLMTGFNDLVQDHVNPNDTRAWTIIQSPEIVGLPIQEDGVNCGVFMLMAARLVLEGHTANWFQPSMVLLARLLIAHELLYGLVDLKLNEPHGVPEQQAFVMGFIFVWNTYGSDLQSRNADIYRQAVQLKTFKCGEVVLLLGLSRLAVEEFLNSRRQLTQLLTNAFPDMELSAVVYVNGHGVEEWDGFRIRMTDEEHDRNHDYLLSNLMQSVCRLCNDYLIAHLPFCESEGALAEISQVFGDLNVGVLFTAACNEQHRMLALKETATQTGVEYQFVEPFTYANYVYTYKMNPNTHATRKPRPSALIGNKPRFVDYAVEACDAVYAAYENTVSCGFTTFSRNKMSNWRFHIAGNDDRAKGIMSPFEIAVVSPSSCTTKISDGPKLFQVKYSSIAFVHDGLFTETNMYACPDWNEIRRLRHVMGPTRSIPVLSNTRSNTGAQSPGGTSKPDDSFSLALASLTLTAPYNSSTPPLASFTSTSSSDRPTPLSVFYTQIKDPTAEKDRVVTDAKSDATDETSGATDETKSKAKEPELTTDEEEALKICTRELPLKRTAAKNQARLQMFRNGEYVICPNPSCRRWVITPLRDRAWSNESDKPEVAARAAERRNRAMKALESAGLGRYSVADKAAAIYCNESCQREHPTGANSGRSDPRTPKRKQSPQSSHAKPRTNH